MAVPPCESSLQGKPSWQHIQDHCRMLGIHPFPLPNISSPSQHLLSHIPFPFHTSPFPHPIPHFQDLPAPLSHQEREANVFFGQEPEDGWKQPLKSIINGYLEENLAWQESCWIYPSQSCLQTKNASFCCLFLSRSSQIPHCTLCPHPVPYRIHGCEHPKFLSGSPEALLVFLGLEKPSEILEISTRP